MAEVFGLSISGGAIANILAPAETPLEAALKPEAANRQTVHAIGATPNSTWKTVMNFKG